MSKNEIIARIELLNKYEEMIAENEEEEDDE